MNEPNMLSGSGAPQGYRAADYARDQDIFGRWLKENYPSCLFGGPCTLGEGVMGKGGAKSGGAGIGSLMQMCSTDELMHGASVLPDVFSYHYYNGISERLASLLPEAHWDSSEAHSSSYLAIAAQNARTYAPLRDRYVPGGQMWVTESGDAGGGGNTWACTFLDVFRTLNELGSFSEISDGIIFHNTLASSDYGALDRETHAPRPNYFAFLLWNTLMGDKVYACPDPHQTDLQMYCRSRKDGKAGFAYLIINHSLSEQAVVDLPKEAEVYVLSAQGPIRSQTMCLNNEALSISDIADLPDLRGEQKHGVIELPPATCTFILI